MLPWRCSPKPLPRDPPSSPIILDPTSGHPWLGMSGSYVQDDGGGERVWVPSIPLGCDGADLVPPSLGPRERPGGDQILLLKIGGLILVMIMIADQLLHPKEPPRTRHMTETPFRKKKTCCIKNVPSLKSYCMQNPEIEASEWRQVLLNPKGLKT